jgi:hypothetical protein
VNIGAKAALEYPKQKEKEDGNAMEDPVAPNDNPVLEEEVNLNEVMNQTEQGKEKKKKKKKLTERESSPEITDLHKDDPNILKLDEEMEKEIMGQIDAMTENGLRCVDVLL